MRLVPLGQSTGPASRLDALSDLGPGSGTIIEVSAKNHPTPSPDDGTEIIDINIVNELESSFLEYSMSVIMSRALPDVRDGLKPVHRRILFAMSQANLRPNGPYTKCQSVVGTTMGKYHPHGDAAIYDALVRMAQDFSLRLPLVDGHGNFGSLDDPPAAARYCVVGDTRVRLADGTSPRIADLVNLPADSEADADFEVINRDGDVVHVSRVFNSGVHPTRRIVTSLGFELRGTDNHPVLCVEPGGVTADGSPAPDRPVWKTLGEIHPLDLIYLATHAPHELVDDPAASTRAALLLEGVSLSDPVATLPEELWLAHPSVKFAVLTALAPELLTGGETPLASRVLAIELRNLALEFGILAIPVTTRRGTGEWFLHALPAAVESHPARPFADLVVTAEDDAPAEVYSLRVDTEDHSFLAGGFVNHNTECRMASAAVAMTAELDEGTVDFEPTYDNHAKQPVVLPAAFPNLLVNGSQGIAVGMATNMAPHNLSEVLAACRALMENPRITVEDLMRIVPGPDLPTGAVIVGREGIEEAYRTGRGTIRIRARAEITDLAPRRRAIVVTQLPYLVKVEKDVMETIKRLVNEKRLPGVVDVKDLSDRKSGMRLVIQVKTGFDPQAVLEELFKLTPLETSFAINNVALVNQKPHTLGLLDLVRYYVEHRREVVRRRTEHRRRVAADRLHIVDGLVIALASIDEVVAAIRSSKDTDTARTKLMRRFQLTEIQTNHILEMPLRRLTSLEVAKLKAEQKELRSTIKDLDDILAKPKRIDAIVVEEFAAVEKEFATPRRTTILDAVPVYEAASLEIADEPCLVTLSVGDVLSVHEAVNGAVPPFKGRRGAADVLSCQVATTRRSTVLVATNRGRCLPLGIVDLPALSAKSRGVPLSPLVGLGAGERVVALLAPTHGVVLVTRDGVIKRIADGQLPSRAAAIIALRDDDELVAAFELTDADAAERDLVMVSSDAQLLRTPLGPVRPQGAPAGGVSGMRLGDGARVISAGLLTPFEGDDPVVLLTQVAETGSVKVSRAQDYPTKGRGTGGVRCHTMKKGESTLSLAYVGPHVASRALAGATVLDLPATLAKRDGSGTPLDGGPLTAAGMSRP